MSILLKFLKFRMSSSRYGPFRLGYICVTKEITKKSYSVNWWNF